MASRTLPATLAVLGLIGLGGAVLLALAARFAPAQSLEDLGRIVGALLLAAAAGILFGGSLLAARLSRADLPRWLVAAATVGSLLALVPGVAFLQPALSSSNWGLAAFAGLVLLAGIAGLASAPGAWRRQV
jgi:hypothetical protein